MKQSTTTEQNPVGNRSSATCSPSASPHGPHSEPTVFPPVSKKTKPGDGRVRSSSYFKIRTIINELRPRFIEVVQTPDFRNCQAAHEIRGKIKLLMDECKRMTVERNKPDRSNSQFQHSSGESVFGQESLRRHQDGKQQPVPQPQLFENLTKDVFGNKWWSRPYKEKHPKMPQPAKSAMPFRAVRSNDSQLPGSYIVGGSTSGWNFILYGGKKPVYYGMTKKSFRSKMKKCHKR